MPDTRRDDALARYRARRDAGATPEPFSDVEEVACEDARGAPSPRFVVQRHSARRLHYDLRLERGGVLASWAVPKGLPLVHGRRRLAVRTEDHPLAYLDFEGEIPAGQYGAGVMDVYDTGPYELLGEHAGGRLDIRLGGARLRGVWTLVPGRADAPDEWLLIRADGPPARDAPRYPPMLPLDVARLPDAAGGSAEALLDGLRVIARLDDGDVTLWTHGGVDAAPLVPRLVHDLGRGLRTFSCVIDGVAAAVDADGVPRPPTGDGRGEPVVLFAFDVLEHEGAPVVDLPQRDRRALLAELVDERTGVVRLSRAFPDAAGLLAAARERGLPGIVVRDDAAPYRPGRRSPAWLAVRTEASHGPPAADRLVAAARDAVHGPDEEVLPGATRGAIASYYAAVASALLPHLRDRPLVLPSDRSGAVLAQAPGWLRRAELPAERGHGAEREAIPVLLVDDLRGLLWLVDRGCLELRATTARADDGSRPDRLVLDLAPTPGAGFDDVRALALDVRDALAGIGLAGYAATSGGDGIHVVVPIARGPDHAAVRGLARTIAAALVRARPDRASDEVGDRRGRRVVVGWRCNDVGSGLLVPYSVRARDGAPVACPLAWEELEAPLDPAALTLVGMRERVARLGDLHVDVLCRPQDVARLVG